MEDSVACVIRALASSTTERDSEVMFSSSQERTRASASPVMHNFKKGFSFECQSRNLIFSDRRCNGSIVML
jgi:hypothetical protein